MLSTGALCPLIYTAFCVCNLWPLHFTTATVYSTDCLRPCIEFKVLYHLMRHLASIPVVNHIISHIILQGLPNLLPIALVSQGAMTSPATFPSLCPLRSTSALHVFGVSGCPLSNIVLNNISVPPAPSALLAEVLRIHVRSALHRPLRCASQPISVCLSSGSYRPGVFLTPALLWVPIAAPVHLSDLATCTSCAPV